ncbi:MAG: hypothetical protein ACI33J_06030 [Clostridium sp.]
MNDENNIDNIKNTNKKNTLNEEKIIKIEEFNEKLMSIYTDVDARFNYQNRECIFNKYLNENNENISILQMEIIKVLLIMIMIVL